MDSTTDVSFTLADTWGSSAATPCGIRNPSSARTPKHSFGTSCLRSSSITNLCSGIPKRSPSGFSPTAIRSRSRRNQAPFKLGADTALRSGISLLP